MSAYRSSLFRSLKKEVPEKLPQGWQACGLPCAIASDLKLPVHVRAATPYELQ